jgi:predicted AAA+ superfamily ATPase
MNRTAQSDLRRWLDSNPRKPLVMRGARQVGKTWLVRTVARENKLELIELNFEKEADLKTLFESNDPQRVLAQLEVRLGRSIDATRTLLFLDEIQAFPELLPKLRWFYEEMPELAIVAAGSLLDFVLADHTFSMPVGRISYYHLEPLSFEEFLTATDKGRALEMLQSLSIDEIRQGDAILGPIHEMLLEQLRIYTLVGGMPDAMATWINTGSLVAVSQIHQELLSTYRDDFSKYSGRIDRERLDEVTQCVPRMLGNKFKYASVNRQVRSDSVKQALRLLCTARIVHKVEASSATGIPLGATVNSKSFKVIFLDCGLASAALGLQFVGQLSPRELVLANEGALAEQLVGQALRVREPYFVEPKLYYWLREKKGSESEVDYVIQNGMELLPIEVKAGRTGSLKSLHVFMHERQLPHAIRLNAEPPSVVRATSSVVGHPCAYNLLSLPLYMAGQVSRLGQEIARMK